MASPPVALINAVVASDWELNSGVGVGDAAEDLRRCVEGAHDKIKFVLRTASAGINLGNIFPALRPEPATFAVLVIMAHTAPVNAAAKPDPRNASGQLLCLSGKGTLSYVPFEKVAAAVRKSTKRAKYDLIILACCQGDKLVPLLESATKPGGVIIHFGGPGESPTDGVHLFLAQDAVEKALELMHACVVAGESLNAAELFRQVYTQLGLEYMGPSGPRQFDRDPGGEYLYASYVLTCSADAALALPDYVKDYTFAGHLHGVMTGAGDLVDDKLRAKRAEFMARAQRDADRAQAAGGAAEPAAPSP